MLVPEESLVCLAGLFIATCASPLLPWTVIFCWLFSPENQAQNSVQTRLEGNPVCWSGPDPARMHKPFSRDACKVKTQQKIRCQRVRANK